MNARIGFYSDILKALPDSLNNFRIKFSVKRQSEYKKTDFNFKTTRKIEKINNFLNICRKGNLNRNGF